MDECYESEEGLDGQTGGKDPVYKGQIFQGDTTGANGWGDDFLRRCIDRGLPDIRTCYEFALEENHALGGSLETKFAVGPEGRFLTSTTSGNGDEVLDDCVNRYVEGLRFPKTGGRTINVSSSLHFQPPVVFCSKPWPVQATELYCDASSIPDLSPLASFKELKHLNIECQDEFGIFVTQKEIEKIKQLEAMVTDLGPLSKLTNLDELSLANCPGVRNLGPLAKLTGLQSLSLDRTDFSDAAPLSKLTKLKELTLSQTGVSDLRQLVKLTELEVLDLSWTGVTDLGPLTKLTKLTKLTLLSTKVSDLGPLRELTNLEVLDLKQTQVTDLRALSYLTNLKTLDLSWTGVTDLEPLVGLMALEVLTIGASVPKHQVEELQESLPDLKIQ
jgi:hypothetical protein